MTASDLALASLVALRPDRIGTTCPAWIESAGRPCGRPQTIGLLCARHHKAAESRWAEAVEREKARLARSAASAREIETKRARLADLDAEIARLVHLLRATALPTLRHQQRQEDQGECDHD